MWKRILEYQITETTLQTKNTNHIHGFLKAHGYSSAVIRHLKETENGICRNGTWARIHDPLIPGDVLTIQLTEAASSQNIVPAPLPLSIVYEDEDLLVIDKPAGMPIHPSQGNYNNTLANACAWYFDQKNEPFTYRCINRLDRDTTGLLILARHMYSASLLSAMVAKREIHRQYLAIVEGILPERGTVDAPIGRRAGSTIEREVNEENGEPARTHFQRLARMSYPGTNKDYSLAALSLETGRTHQIRVHMKHLGHPLPGDFLYNPDYSVIGRQALHSYRLTFRHPITGTRMDFLSPLPEDMLLCQEFREAALHI